MPKEYFSEAQKKEILSQAIQFWDNATQRQAPFFDKVNDYERLYHVKLPQKLHDAFEKRPDRASMVPPDIYNNIRSFRAHMNKLLFNSKPYATVSIAGLPNQRSETTNKAESLLSTLLDISNYRMDADKIHHQACYAGVSAGITDWYQQYRRVAETYPGSNQPAVGKNGQFIWKKKLVAEYPRTVGVDIRRVRLDDKAENMKDVRIFGYHVKKNISDLITLKNDPQSFIDFDVDKLKKSPFPHNDYYQYVTEETPLKSQEDRTPYGDMPIELIEERGIFRIGDDFVDLIVKIANREYVIEARPNNLPVYGWETIDIAALDNEFNRIFTMGTVEPAIDVFLEQFIKRNQAIDIANQGAYQMYLSDAAATSELPDRIQYIGGKIYPLNMAATGAQRLSDVFMPIPTPGNPIDTFSQSESCRNDVKTTMRRADYVQSGQPSRKETATAVDALVESGNRDVEQAVDFLTMSFHFPAWKKYLRYWDFFKGHADAQTTDAEGRKVMIQAGEMNQAFELSVDIAAAVQRPMAQRRMIEAVPYFMNAPESDKYWVLNTLGWLLDLPNRDKMLPPPELPIANIERENIALSHGLQVPVHPADNHPLHIEYHTKQAEAAAKDPQREMSDAAIAAYDRHIQEHQQYIDQVNNPAGVNTPKLSGANTGQMAGGASPGMSGTQLKTTTPG